MDCGCRRDFAARYFASDSCDEAEDEAAEGGGKAAGVPVSRCKMEEVDVEEVLKMRLSESQVMVEEARKDRRTMLSKLGFLGSDGKPRVFQGQLCNVVVSSGFVVDGWDCGRREMRVNHKYSLSLDPSVVGQFLGIDFTGPIPDQRTSQEKLMELEEFIEEPGMKRMSRSCTFRGLAADSLEPGLRNYIKKRRPMLGFPDSHSQLAQTQVYAFKEELYCNKHFNWVSVRVLRIQTALERRSRKCKLSDSLKTFLTDYIQTALSYAGLATENRKRAPLTRLGPDEQSGSTMATCMENRMRDAPRLFRSHQCWQQGTKMPKREFPEDQLVQVQVQHGLAVGAKIRKLEDFDQLSSRLEEVKTALAQERRVSAEIQARLSRLEAQSVMPSLHLDFPKARRREEEECTKEQPKRPNLLDRLKRFLG